MARRLSFTLLLPAIAVLAIVLSTNVHAGPITGGGGSSPFVKLGVYQGVISLIPPGGSNVMYLGNAGRDIASTGTMYIRPGGLTADRICYSGTNPGAACPNGTECLGGGFCVDQAASLYKYPSYAEAALDLTGSLCLHGTGSSDCKNIWPSSGGAGDPYWQTSTVGGLTVLSPATGGTTIHTVRIGSAASPVPAANGQAFQVYANYAGPAVHVLGSLIGGENDSSYVPIGTGTIVINGSLKAGPYGLLSYYTPLGAVYPWTSADSYLYKTGYPSLPETQLGDVSGIDADTFDSVSLTSMLFPNNGNLFVRKLSYASPASGDTITRTSICIKTTASGICVTGPTIGRTCTTSGDCGGGTCQTMCTATQASCPADRVYTTVAPDTGKFCNAASGKLYTKTCKNVGTNTQYQQACTTDTDCASLGAGVTCQNAYCYDYYTCSAPARQVFTCKPGDPTWGDAHCNAIASGSTCSVPPSSCPSGGECRPNFSSGAVIPGTSTQVFAGFCYNFTPCTDNAQCGGSAGSSTLCSGASFCSWGNDVGAYTPNSSDAAITKHCVGGSRKAYECQGGARDGQYCMPGYPGTISDCGGGTCVARPVRCDQSNVCVGGIADGRYDDHDPANIAACQNYNGYASTYPELGGQIGNAVDYCPGGGTCVPDTLCFSNSDCFMNQACINTVALTAPNFGSCNPSSCDTYCKNTPINRCSGATNVYGANINSCTASGFGQNLNYTGGSCQCGYDSLCPTFNSAYCVCNTNTTERPYVTATPGAGEICTSAFQ